MPAPTPITITALLQSIAGTAATTGAKLRISLCGFGDVQPWIAGTSILAQTFESKTFSGVALSFPIFGNDVISPAGTFYCIRTEDANGNTIAAADYIFTGAGPIDLSSAQPMSTSYLTSAVPNGPTPGRVFKLPSNVFEGGLDSLLYYNGALETNYSVANKRLALNFDTMAGDALFFIYTTNAYGTGPIFTPSISRANGALPGSFFTLPTPPSGAQFAGVFYNGALQLPLSSALPGATYTLTSSGLTFNFNLIETDVVQVLYFVGPALPAIVADIPAGAYPGTVYTLASAPPAGMLWLYNTGGQFLRPGIDYTVSGLTITLKFSTQAGDQLYAYHG